MAESGSEPRSDSGLRASSVLGSIWGHQLLAEYVWCWVWIAREREDLMTESNFCEMVFRRRAIFRIIAFPFVWREDPLTVFGFEKYVGSIPVCALKHGPQNTISE